MTNEQMIEDCAHVMYDSLNQPSGWSWYKLHPNAKEYYLKLAKVCINHYKFNLGCIAILERDHL